MAHLNLDFKKVERCRQLAREISAPVEQMIDRHSTIAIERATLRLIGVEGAVQQARQVVPEVNIIVDDLMKAGALSRGVLIPFVNGMIQTGLGVRELASKAASRKVRLS